MKYLKRASAIGLLSATSIALEVVTVSIPACLHRAGVATSLPGAEGATQAERTGPEPLKVAVTGSQSLGSTSLESLTATGTSAVTQVPTTLTEVTTSRGTYEDVGTIALLPGGAAPLNGPVTSDSQMSVEYCANICQGSEMFALYNGDTCNCGNEANTSTRRKLRKRDLCIPCSGRSIECCGMRGLAVLYENKKYPRSSTSVTHTRGIATIGPSKHSTSATHITVIATIRPTKLNPLVPNTTIVIPIQPMSSAQNSGVEAPTKTTVHIQTVESNIPAGTTTVAGHSMAPVAPSPSYSSSTSSYIASDASSSQGANKSTPTSTHMSTDGGSSVSTEGGPHTPTGANLTTSATGQSIVFTNAPPMESSIGTTIEENATTSTTGQSIILTDTPPMESSIGTTTEENATTSTTGQSIILTDTPPMGSSIGTNTGENATTSTTVQSIVLTNASPMGSSIGATTGAATPTSTPIPPGVPYNGQSPKCPDQNGKYYTTPLGNTYNITCGVPIQGQAADNIFHADSYTACLEACDLLQGCQAATYSACTSPTCTNCNAYYSFSTYGSGTDGLMAGVNVNGPNDAQDTTDDPCGAGMTNYTDSFGQTYALSCGFDVSGATALVSVDTTNFEACMDYCSLGGDCVAVTYTGPHAPGTPAANCNTFSTMGTLISQMSTDYAVYVS